MVNRIISPYINDGTFLLGTLRKSILMIIAKDNIDQNSNSTTAPRQYYGILLSVFLFSIDENPGTATEYGDLEF